jgi:hypothetical protein
MDVIFFLPGISPVPAAMIPINKRPGLNATMGIGEISLN